jgi:hypothetical protein
MTQETTQAQVPTPAEQPARSHRNSLIRGLCCPEEAMVELTDADLQAVSGGGSKPGIGSGSN